MLNRFWFFLAVISIIFGFEGAHAGFPTVTFESDAQRLKVEVWRDDLIHFEWSSTKFPRTPDSHPIFTTPMVADTKYPGPTNFKKSGESFETPELRARVERHGGQICLQVRDLKRAFDLTTLCPVDLQNDTKFLDLDPAGTQNVYGLGQYHMQPESADGDWVGKTFYPGPQGNEMRCFMGCGPSITQFPVLYALKEKSKNFALFLDHPYKLTWDLARVWWRAETWGDQLRGFVIAGPDLKDLRHDYMELTGRPPVPPKKIFGLWVSEFGYLNWGEVDSVLDSLRKNKFPVEGFALDLQWYGGKFGDPDHSRMGTLQFDNEHFPNAREKVASYRSQDVELMLIEQSYVGKNLPEHEALASRGFLAKDCENCGPTYISSNPWWGRGGIIDWSNSAAGAYWHETKRQSLADWGLRYHWTDLGEPEMFNSWAHYHGVEPGKNGHGDIHNLFNLLWAQSISDGYAKSNSRDRHYIMARAGAPGLQRFGAGMWSGDIGANMDSLKAHFNAQMHLSFAGIDYYSADIGGFHRWASDGDLNELYTQWFAAGSLLDFPVRPHVWNLPKDKKTAPDSIGDFESNRDNLRLRYELIPYYYSLAHRAYREGEPIIAPMVYYFQEDPELRKVGHEKMIGPNLLVGILAGHGQNSRQVYFPKGTWIDYRTDERHVSEGRNSDFLSVYKNGRFQLPLFARDGAIIPLAYVDDQTWSVSGRRAEGGPRDELRLRVYPTEQGSEFTIYEDDGRTVDYRSAEGREGKVRVTRVEQKIESGRVRVKVEGSRGSFEGASESRDVFVEIVLQGSSGFHEAWLGGKRVPSCSGPDQWKTPGQTCAAPNGPTRWVIRAAGLKDSSERVFELR